MIMIRPALVPAAKVTSVFSPAAAALASLDRQLRAIGAASTRLPVWPPRTRATR